MVHDSGARRGREARLARRFPDAAVVVFGHSHEPVDTLGVGGQRLFNPGSPTQRRRQPQPSYGELELRDGAVVSHRVVLLG
jgi:predicted phosphodiesterase